MVFLIVFFFLTCLFGSVIHSICLSYLARTDEVL